MKPTQAQHLAQIARRSRQLALLLCQERDAAAQARQRDQVAQYDQMAAEVTTIAQTLEAQVWNLHEGRAA